jgi:rod shape-determining protein MreD
VRTDRLSRLLFAAAPSALAVALVLLASLPWGLPHFSMLCPMVGLIAVYYWTVHRPDLMPASGAFAIGLVTDLVSGAPLGLDALVLTLAHWVTRANRRALLGESFALVWLGFLAVAAGAGAAYWLAASLFWTAILPPRALVAQLVVTVAVYPLAAQLFALAQRRLPVRA